MLYELRTFFYSVSQSEEVLGIRPGRYGPTQVFSGLSGQSCRYYQTAYFSVERRIYKGITFIGLAISILQNRRINE